MDIRAFNYVTSFWQRDAQRHVGGRYVTSVLIVTGHILLTGRHKSEELTTKINEFIAWIKMDKLPKWRKTKYSLNWSRLFVHAWVSLCF